MVNTQVIPSTRGSKSRAARKSRASVACGTCRARKVRCSVASDGPPCTNCRLDGLLCSVPRSRRGRRTSLASNIDNSSVPEPADSASGPGAHEPHAGDPFVDDGQETWLPEEEINTPAFAEETMICTHHPEDVEPTIVCSAPEPARPESSRVGWTEFSASQLPDFITPITLPPRRGIAEYLSANEAFFFPSTAALRADIIHGYLRGVHCYYPILDMNHLLPLTHDLPVDDSPSQISLLTFQAMMFAAIPYVDEATCQRLGFASQKEARNSLYTRVKLLYDAEVETRCAPVAQALLLLSVWFDEGGIGRDAWYWTACLAHLVEKAEVWRFLGNGPQSVMTATLWWCVLVRDAHVALVMRQPTRLHRFHKMAPIPDLSEIASTSTVGSHGSSPKGVSEVPGHQAASSFLLNIKLAQIMARILQNDPEQVLPGSSPSSFDLESCERDLATWSADFSVVFPTAKQKLQRADRETGPLITVSLILHDTTLNALYLPQIYLSRESANKLIPGILSYSSKMRRAAARTAILAEEALASEWADIIPTQFFTALVPAAPVHILDLKSPRADLQSASRHSLGACIRLLRHLEPRFDLARHLRLDILRMVSKLGLTLNEGQDGVGGFLGNASLQGFETSPSSPGASNPFFIHIGDPLDDECWAGTPLAASPGRCTSVHPSPSAHQDFLGQVMLDGSSGMVPDFGRNEHTPGPAATPNSRIFHQELQGWFEDIMAGGQVI